MTDADVEKSIEAIIRVARREIPALRRSTPTAPAAR